jgi:hypothetical protein
MYTIIEYLNVPKGADTLKLTRSNLTITVTLTLNQNEAVQTSTVPEFS